MTHLTWLSSRLSPPPCFSILLLLLLISPWETTSFSVTTTSLKRAPTAVASTRRRPASATNLPGSTTKRVTTHLYADPPLIGAESSSILSSLLLQDADVALKYYLAYVVGGAGAGAFWLLYYLAKYLEAKTTTTTTTTRTTRRETTHSHPELEEPDQNEQDSLMTQPMSQFSSPVQLQQERMTHDNGTRTTTPSDDNVFSSSKNIVGDDKTEPNAVVVHQRNATVVGTKGEERGLRSNETNKKQADVLLENKVAEVAAAELSSASSLSSQGIVEQEVVVEPIDKHMNITGKTEKLESNEQLWSGSAAPARRFGNEKVRNSVRPVVLSTSERIKTISSAQRVVNGTNSTGDIGKQDVNETWDPSLVAANRSEARLAAVVTGSASLRSDEYTVEGMNTTGATGKQTGEALEEILVNVTNQSDSLLTRERGLVRPSTDNGVSVDGHVAAERDVTGELEGRQAEVSWEQVSVSTTNQTDKPAGNVVAARDVVGVTLQSTDERSTDERKPADELVSEGLKATGEARERRRASLNLKNKSDTLSVDDVAQDGLRIAGTMGEQANESKENFWRNVTNQAEKTWSIEDIAAAVLSLAALPLTSLVAKRRTDEGVAASFKQTNDTTGSPSTFSGTFVNEWTDLPTMWKGNVPVTSRSGSRNFTMVSSRSASVGTPLPSSDPMQPTIANETSSLDASGYSVSRSSKALPVRDVSSFEPSDGTIDANTTKFLANVTDGATGAKTDASSADNTKALFFATTIDDPRFVSAPNHSPTISDQQETREARDKRDQDVARMKRSFFSIESALKQELLRMKTMLEEQKDSTNEHISKLKQELVQVKALLSKSKSKARRREGRFTRRVGEVTAELDRSRIQFESEKARHRILESEFSLQISMLEGKVFVTESRLQEKSDAISKLKEDHKKLSDELSLSLQEAQKEIESLQNEVADARSLLEDERANVKEYRSKVVDSETIVSQLQKKLEQVPKLETDVEERRKALVVAEEEKFDQLRKLNELQKAYQEVSDRLANYEDKADENSHLVAKLRQSEKQASRSSEEFTLTIKELEDKLTEERSAKETLIERLGDIQADLKLKENRLSRLPELQGRLAEAIQERDNTRLELGRVERELGLKHNQITKLNSKYSAMVDKFKAKLEEHNTAKQLLKAQVLSLELDLAAKLERLDTEIPRLTSQVQQYSNTIENVREKLTEAEAEVRKQKKLVVDMEAEFSVKLQTTVEKLTDDKSLLQSRVKALEEHEEVREQWSKESANKQLNRIIDLQSKVEQLTNAKDSLKSMLDAVEAKYRKNHVDEVSYTNATWTELNKAAYTSARPVESASSLRARNVNTDIFMLHTEEKSYPSSNPSLTETSKSAVVSSEPTVSTATRVGNTTAISVDEPHKMESWPIVPKGDTFVTGTEAMPASTDPAGSLPLKAVDASIALASRPDQDVPNLDAPKDNEALTESNNTADVSPNSDSPPLVKSASPHTVLPEARSEMVDPKAGAALTESDDAAKASPESTVSVSLTASIIVGTDNVSLDGPGEPAPKMGEPQADATSTEANRRADEISTTIMATTSRPRRESANAKNILTDSIRLARSKVPTKPPQTLSAEAKQASFPVASVFKSIPAVPVRAIPIASKSSSSFVAVNTSQVEHETPAVNRTLSKSMALNGTFVPVEPANLPAASNAGPASPDAPPARVSASRKNDSGSFNYSTFGDKSESRPTKATNLLLAPKSDVKKTKKNIMSALKGLSTAEWDIVRELIAFRENDKVAHSFSSPTSTYALKELVLAWEEDLDDDDWKVVKVVATRARPLTQSTPNSKLLAQLAPEKETGKKKKLATRKEMLDDTEQRGATEKANATFAGADTTASQLDGCRLTASESDAAKDDAMTTKGNKTVHEVLPNAETETLSRAPSSLVETTGSTPMPLPFVPTIPVAIDNNITSEESTTGRDGHPKISSKSDATKEMRSSSERSLAEEKTRLPSTRAAIPAGGSRETSLPKSIAMEANASALENVLMAKKFQFMAQNLLQMRSSSSAVSAQVSLPHETTGDSSAGSPSKASPAASLPRQQVSSASSEASGSRQRKAFTSLPQEGAQKPAIPNVPSIAAASSDAPSLWGGDDDAQIFGHNIPDGVRLQLLREACQYLVVLKGFEGIVPDEEIARLKCELFWSLPRPPPNKFRSTQEPRKDSSTE